MMSLLLRSHWAGGLVGAWDLMVDELNLERGREGERERAWLRTYIYLGGLPSMES
jgi:hypothetical protein